MKIVKRDFFYYSVLAMMSDKEPVKIQKVYNPFDSQCNDASTFELQSEGMNSFCLFIFFFSTNYATFCSIDATTVIKVKKKRQFVEDHPFITYAKFPRSWHVLPPTRTRNCAYRG